MKLPAFDPAGSLSQAITYSTGGVAADGNGFFHPLGDHAQVSFVIDGQPISDQQSKVFSTQLPTSAIQSMEVTTGRRTRSLATRAAWWRRSPPAPASGGRTCLRQCRRDVWVVRHGRRQLRPGFRETRSSEIFWRWTASAAAGSSTLRSSVLSTTSAIIESIFDRLDFQPSGKDAFHLNLFTARNWIQIPNSLDQLGQDQRQRVLTWSIAPGYQHTFNAHTLLTVNPYIRKDQFNYYPSRDLIRRHARHAKPDSPASELGREGGCRDHQGRHNFEVWNRFEADPAARELRVRHHGSDASIRPASTRWEPIPDPSSERSRPVCGRGLQPNTRTIQCGPFSPACFPSI